MSELFDHLDELRGSSRKVAVATLVNTRGTTPRKEGAKMVVGEGGAILGSVTIGGCVDAQVLEAALDLLATTRAGLDPPEGGQGDAGVTGDAISPPIAGRPADLRAAPAGPPRPAPPR